MLEFSPCSLSFSPLSLSLSSLSLFLSFSLPLSLSFSLSLPPSLSLLFLKPLSLLLRPRLSSAQASLSIGPHVLQCSDFLSRIGSSCAFGPFLQAANFMNLTMMCASTSVKRRYLQGAQAAPHKHGIEVKGDAPFTQSKPFKLQGICTPGPPPSSSSPTLPFSPTDHAAHFDLWPSCFA